ncbi:MAG TPA: DUF2721 domain-containing protein [Opitutaceae bacterium]|nr:DUF2721 domain-containing protein [Opitutaceae bacterium]
MPPLSQLVSTLQLAIGPVILISGVGLLLLSFTNRFGRLLDRARLLNRELQNEAAQLPKLRYQIAVLHKRANILRFSILLGAITVLMAACLILGLFLGVLLKVELNWAIIPIFCISQLTLIGSIVAFIREMNLSLTAFRVEIGEAETPSEPRR